MGASRIGCRCQINLMSHAMDESEVLKRLDSIDHKINFLADAYKHIHNVILKAVHVNFEKNLLDPNLSKLTNQISVLERLLYSLNEMTKNDHFLGTMAFMAKKLHEMKMALGQIKEKGINKNIHLDLTMDGYEMVKRGTKIRELEQEPPEDPEEALDALFKTLTARGSLLLAHRFGIFGEKRKTLEATGKAMCVTRERVRQMESKVMRKMRNPTRIELAKKITHRALRKAILGEEE